MDKATLRASFTEFEKLHNRLFSSVRHIAERAFCTMKRSYGSSVHARWGWKGSWPSCISWPWPSIPRSSVNEAGLQGEVRPKSGKQGQLNKKNSEAPGKSSHTIGTYGRDSGKTRVGLIVQRPLIITNPQPKVFGRGLICKAGGNLSTERFPPSNSPIDSTYSSTWPAQSRVVNQ